MMTSGRIAETDTAITHDLINKQSRRCLPAQSSVQTVRASKGIPSSDAGVRAKWLLFAVHA